METQAAHRMKVLEPLDQALQRVKVILFRPFLFATWLRFGFIIFLSTLFGTGFGFRYGFSRESSPADIAHDLSHVLENPVLVAVGIVIIIIFVVIAVIFAYLRSRGDMMLVRAAALNHPVIGDNWRAVRPLADSLFLFRIVLFFIGLLVLGSLAAVTVISSMSLIRDNTNDFVIWFFAVWPFLMAFLLIGATLWTIGMLLHDFVIPFMYQFNEPVTAAWRRFFMVSKLNIGPVLLFYVVRGLYGLLLGIIMFFIGCITCCIGFLPYINQTLFSPLYLFDRLYSMYAVSSLGPAYDLFVQPVIEEPLPPEERIPPPPPEFE